MLFRSGACCAAASGRRAPDSRAARSLAGVVSRPPDGAPQGPPRTVEGAPPVLVTDLASRTLAVKEDDAFLYSDLQGDLHLEDDYGLGFYARDTRFLSRFHLTLSGRAPVLLSSTAERGYLGQIDLTNPDLYEDGELVVPQQTDRKSTRLNSSH